MLGVKKVIAVVFALMLSGPVMANPRSCQQIHQAWMSYKNNSSNFDAGYYAGIIGGFADLLDLMGRINFPPGGTHGAYMRVVGNWLERHPEKWHLDRMHCIWDALEEAYGLK